MLFGEEKDWKEYLTSKEQAELAELIDKTKKHKGAYMEADDVKVAQVWCALAEVSKQLKEIRERLEKLEVTMKAIAAVGDVAKREALEEKVRDMLKVKDSKEREAADKIVDSLMKF